MQMLIFGHGYTAAALTPQLIAAGWTVSGTTRTDAGRVAAAGAQPILWPGNEALLRDQIARACSDLDHEFWADDISLRDTGLVNFDRVRGHNQITDLYLLALAVRHGGSLATFDQGIALSAVVNAQPRHLTLL